MDLPRWIDHATQILEVSTLPTELESAHFNLHPPPPPCLYIFKKTTTTNKQTQQPKTQKTSAYLNKINWLGLEAHKHFLVPASAPRLVYQRP